MHPNKPPLHEPWRCHGLWLQSCVPVYLAELVRLLLQYKWGTIFRQEWFWRNEGLSKMNGNGVWLREVENVLKRHDASLEWLRERITMRDEEIKKIKLVTKWMSQRIAKFSRRREQRVLETCLKKLKFSSTPSSPTRSQRPNRPTFKRRSLPTRAQLTRTSSINRGER